MDSSKPNDQVFTEHLVAVNTNNKVISTEDIVNDNGVLIVKKGAAIDQKVASQVAKHKLKKSISKSIAVENLLDEKAIYSAIHSFLKSHSDLEQIHINSELKKLLQLSCLYAKSFTMLMQQLTVMENNLPDLFKKSIVGAWFALAISKQLGFDSLQCKQIFLASLVRDIGMMHMHLPKEGLTADWKLIQSHVAVGKLVVDDMKELPTLIKKAISEHHERTDGAGYPKAKNAGNLGHSGQVIAMSDAIQAIYLKNSNEREFNVLDLQGFLTLNMSTYGEDIYQSVVRLIRISQCEPISRLSKTDFAAFNKKLINKSKNYMSICADLKVISSLIDENSKQNEVIILKSFVERILQMQARTGIPSDEYERWMQCVQDEQIEEAYAEIEMIGMMFEELTWQISQIKNYLTAFWQLPSSDDSQRAMVEPILVRLNKALNNS